MARLAALAALLALALAARPAPLASQHAPTWSVTEVTHAPPPAVFYRNHLRAHRPVVLRQLAADWPALTKVTDWKEQK